jgi:hypothetical protein
MIEMRFQKGFSTASRLSFENLVVSIARIGMEGQMQTSTATQAQVLKVPHPADSALCRPRYPSVQALITQCRKWVKTCADYHAGASVYEQLSRLSDAELRRRGLSRSTLAQVVSAI